MAMDHVDDWSDRVCERQNAQLAQGRTAAETAVAKLSSAEAWARGVAPLDPRLEEQRRRLEAPWAARCNLAPVAAEGARSNLGYGAPSQLLAAEAWAEARERAGQQRHAEVRHHAEEAREAQRRRLDLSDCGQELLVGGRPLRRRESTGNAAEARRQAQLEKISDWVTRHMQAPAACAVLHV
eukprot:gnl/TRDRNA2_/TRDRNA2_192289_c0_seq1.p1 gnl/TRDRNA2_/TRDRNA2_192289_c0~~gnl/TRDRNA2_/TRDRNA2_192289_c0_seq1.p1  ORF type:complete len:182 (+),score=47.16 gnl/TRDRNA2_/TRDRNA2_192289_c0_seq1:214-759(+)